MPRRIVAIAAGVAGIYVLAGLGWALLVLGVLVEVAWPNRTPKWLWFAAKWSRRHGQMLAGKVRALPQQMTGATAVIAGVALVPAGAWLALGVWAALLVLGALLLSLGLLLDRTAPEKE